MIELILACRRIETFKVLFFIWFYKRLIRDWYIILNLLNFHTCIILIDLSLIILGILPKFHYFGNT